MKKKDNTAKTPAPKKSAPKYLPKNTFNVWARFSRWACIVGAAGAAFCAVCAIGSHFHSVPWGWIAIGIGALIGIESVIWYLGYQSHEPGVFVKETSNQQKEKGNPPVEVYDPDEGNWTE